MSPRSQNPLTLAVLMRALEGGGAQRDMVLLCSALAAKGVHVTILTLRGEGPLRSLLDPAVRVVEVPGWHLRYAIPGLRRVIRAEAPALVMSSEASLNLCALLAIGSLPRHARPKLILREVGSPSIALRRDPYRQNRIAYRLLLRLYRHADAIVALTDGARRDLVANFAVPREMVSLMATNAVIPSQMVERLAQWDFENGRERDLIVSVGRLSPEKDHLTLLRALTLLPPHRRWRLAIVGDGQQRQALEIFVREHNLTGRVIFTGEVTDPFIWMMRARLAVCSSVYEGLGNALIEALACGTPVVSTDCPYGPREILQGGRYGALTPVGDAAALAAAIDAALAAVPDRAALAARGLNYTSVRAAERFLEIAGELQAATAALGGRVAVASVS